MPSLTTSFATYFQDHIDLATITDMMIDEDEDKESENELNFSDDEEPIPTERMELATFKEHSKSHSGFSKTYPIGLRVTSHRGHRGDETHPRNLLDDQGHKSSYQSIEGDPSSDWIIFQMLVRPPVKPSKIFIKNGRTNMAIKMVTLSLGYGDIKGPWLKLIDLTRLSLDKECDIKFANKGGILIDDAVLRKKKFTHIKVEFPQNHGSNKFNEFYTLKLFGRAFLDWQE